MAGRVLIWVQHLLGTGHLHRAARLARAMQAAGLRVTLVAGGPPVAGLDLGGAEVVELPPVRALDAAFRRLVGPDGAPFGAALAAERRERLLAAFEATDPDAVIVETFPFGRRAFRAEALALLEAAAARRPRPLVAASLRDALQTGRRPERLAEAAGLARAHLDAVLVHADPRLVRLEETFAEAAALADLVVYTGFVAAPPAAPGGASGEVLVSAGGGAVGAALLEAALAARPLTALAEAPWRLVAGAAAEPAAVEALARRAPAGVTVDRHLADFRAHLAGARVSVSQAGYNTVVEALAAGVPAVLVPFARGGQSEQSFRAARLAERGLAAVLPEADLGAESLARAVDAAAARPRPALDLDLNGAEATARFVAERVPTAMEAARGLGRAGG